MNKKEKSNIDMDILKKEISLAEKRINEIKDMQEQAGIEVNEEELAKQIEVKHIGKMELVNELGELAEKDVFITFELVGGQLQIRYYDEEQKLIGVQNAIDKDVILASTLSTMEPSEQENIKEELEKVDKEKAKAEAKNIEELKEKQKELEKQKGPQLSKEQAEKLGGPKIDLNQQVDNVTLAKKLDLEGTHIKFVDFNEAKKMIPELKESALGQQFIPIEIGQDGTANVIGEDKLEFSTIEGTNSTDEHITMNNEGESRREQGIITYNIPGTYNCITVGFDEQNTSSPFYEAKFGTRDPEEPDVVKYDELQTVHEGPIKSASESEVERRKNTEGIYEASTEVVSKEAAREYANLKGYYLEGRKPDIEKAREELEELSRGDKNVEEIIQEAEEDVKTLGPNQSY